MSEIVNGQRAHYAGTFLVPAGGHKFPTPQWFTADLSPDIQLNGVLSAGRRKRQDAVSVVGNANPPAAPGEITFQILILWIIRCRFHLKCSFCSSRASRMGCAARPQCDFGVIELGSANHVWLHQPDLFQFSQKSMFTILKNFVLYL